MNVTLDFGNVLTRAWQIMWRNRILWLFGVLASCGRGGGGGSGGGNNINSNVQVDPNGVPQFNLPPQVERFFQSADVWMIVLAIVCVSLLVAIVILVLQTLGVGGLIGGIAKAEATGSVTFAEAWSVATAKFTRLLGLTIIVFVITLVAVLLVVAGSVAVGVLTFGIGLICLLPFFCLLAIVAAIFGLLVEFAQIAAVVDDLSVMDALRRAWELFRANLANVIILGLIVGVIGLVIGLVAAIPLLAIVIPAVIGVAGFANENQAVGTGALAFALVCFCLYLPVLIVVGGMLQTWATSAYTLAYQQLTRPTTPPAPLAAEPPPPSPLPA